MHLGIEFEMNPVGNVEAIGGTPIRQQDNFIATTQQIEIAGQRIPEHTFFTYVFVVAILGSDPAYGDLEYSAVNAIWPAQVDFSKRADFTMDCRVGAGRALKGRLHGWQEKQSGGG